ncbi:hypothetical protein SAY87_009390 [Trapa incisa]|uniref:Uncharacterized protein n=1 Tax=Trapa incisa TaxID=236973 RepID=A0AAN7K1L4_9MYRT|nr:hypothetical protein SAY87_009390 [Trapa incisa]
MDRLRAIVKVPICPGSEACYRVAVSLLLSPTSKTLTVPSVNTIFFNGDRVEGTRNPVIERLSDLQHIADTLVLKFGGSSNVWVIEASTFNGPFAVYKDFIPSVNQHGEPKEYCTAGFPASTSTVSLLSKCIEEVKKIIPRSNKPVSPISSLSQSEQQAKSVVLGFSKGGTVLNQLVAELSDHNLTCHSYSCSVQAEQQSWERAQTSIGAIEILPSTKECFLNSLVDLHYVDVGLNTHGSYITEYDVIARISTQVAQGDKTIRFFIHGTPRQWRDRKRAWIREEKDCLVHLLQSESRKAGSKLQVSERLYFSDRHPDLQMHFEIIEKLDVSLDS